MDGCKRTFCPKIFCECCRYVLQKSSLWQFCTRSATSWGRTLFSCGFSWRMLQPLEVRSKEGRLAVCFTSMDQVTKKNLDLNHSATFLAFSLQYWNMTLTPFKLCIRQLHGSQFGQTLWCELLRQHSLRFYLFIRTPTTASFWTNFIVKFWNSWFCFYGRWHLGWKCNSLSFSNTHLSPTPNRQLKALVKCEILQYSSVHHPAQGNWWSTNVSRPRSQVGVIAVGSKVSSRDILWNRVDQFYIHIARSSILFTLFRSSLREASSLIASVLLWHYYFMFLQNSTIEISPFCHAAKHLSRFSRFYYFLWLQQIYSP